MSHCDVEVPLSDYGRTARRPTPARPGLDVAHTIATLKRELEERKVDLDTVLQAVVNEAVARMHADRGTLYLVDRVREELVSRVAMLPEISEIRLRMGEGVAGSVAARGEIINVPAHGHDPRFTERVDRSTGYVTRSLLAVPVTDPTGEIPSDSPVIIGVLQVLNKKGDEAFTSNDVEELQALAAGVGALLTTSSLASQLSDDSNQTLSFGYNQIIGDSSAMRAVFARTARAARTAATVLVRGESGTGKELITRAVHDNSDRRERPFVVVDLTSIPAELVESELFGHARGAFTGAVRKSEGRVVQADGGTLFLDEIGELPLAMQAKLLRLLQSRTVHPVGTGSTRSVDVRFVCATHRDLEQMVQCGEFREDLYYRIRVVEIVVPPLRDRGHGDLDRLIDHFLFQFRRRHGRMGVRLAPEARARLHAHRWPGNVRELQNQLESALILAPSSTIRPEELRLGDLTPPSVETDDTFRAPLQPLDSVERAYVRWALRQHDGNRSATARALGIGRNTLLRKLREED